MKNKIRTSVVNTMIWGGMLLSLLIFFTSCSKERIMDRYDERRLNDSENQSNLYDYGDPEIMDTVHSVPEGVIPEPDELFYGYRNLEEMKSFPTEWKELKGKYALLSICWKRNPPVLRFWKRILNPSQWVDLTVPITSANSRLLKVSAEDGTDTYRIAVPVRQHTCLPWIVQDDYEIFIVQAEKHKNGDWTLKSIRQLTDNRNDDIQPVFTPDGKSLIFVSIDDNIKTLKSINIETSEEKIIAEQASLPYIMPDTGKLLYVSEKNVLRDFITYDLNTAHREPASPEELSVAISGIPYSALKSKYMLINNLNFQKEEKGDKRITLENLLFNGLRTAPVILKDFYKYTGAMSATSASLYDEGPDLFSSGTVIPKENIFTSPDDSEDYPISDRIATENFLRLIMGLSVPIIPNLPLRFATYDKNKCLEEVYRQHLHKTINGYVSDMTSAYFDNVEAEMLLPVYRDVLSLNRRRLAQNRKTTRLGNTLPARVLFAENTLLTAKSDFNAAAEQFIHSKFVLKSLLGIRRGGDIKVDSPPLNKLLPSINIPPLSYFQAQAQINHPDIQRLDAMILKAAATRDMGPPSRRIDSVRLNVSYGLGFDNWSKLVDDFLQVSLTGMVPLRLPILDNAYYDSWTAQINSLRQEKYQVQAQIKQDVHSAYMNLNVLEEAIKGTEKRLAFQKENYRLSKIYDRLGRLEFQRDDLDKWLLNYPIVAKLKMLETRRKLISSKCELYRRMAKLYAASGIATRLIPALCIVTEPVEEKRTPEATSLFLWKTVETLTDKRERERFLQLCSDTGINKVYCFISRTPDKELYLEKYDLEIGYFLDLCAGRNIKVYAMMGNTGWITPEYRKESDVLISTLNRFNTRQKADCSAQFAGLILDVEPHALPEWHTDRQKQLADAYLQMLKRVRKKYRGELGVVIPYTYTGISAGKPKEEFLQAISANCDRITLMAYLNTIDKIRRKVNPILQKQYIKIPVEIAIETADVKEYGISFHDKDFNEVKKVCVKLREDYRKNRLFDGIAIHDYAGLSKLEHKPEIERGAENGNKTEKN